MRYVRVFDFGCCVGPPSISVPSSPTLADANNSECDDSTNDEEADDRHEAVEIAPPPSAFVLRLIEQILVISGSGVTTAELALGVVRLKHPVLGVWGQREESSNHPR